MISSSISLNFWISCNILVMTIILSCAIKRIFLLMNHCCWCYHTMQIAVLLPSWLLSITIRLRILIVLYIPFSKVVGVLKTFLILPSFLGTTHVCDFMVMISKSVITLINLPSLMFDISHWLSKIGVFGILWMIGLVILLVSLMMRTMLLFRGHSGAAARLPPLLRTIWGELT